MEINKSIIVIGYFNSQISDSNKGSRVKICNKAIELKQIDKWKCVGSSRRYPKSSYAKGPDTGHRGKPQYNLRH